MAVPAGTPALGVEQEPAKVMGREVKKMSSSHMKLNAKMLLFFLSRWRASYEDRLSEWLAAEAVVRQRDREQAAEAAANAAR